MEGETGGEMKSFLHRKQSEAIKRVSESESSLDTESIIS